MTDSPSPAAAEKPRSARPRRTVLGWLGWLVKRSAQGTVLSIVLVLAVFVGWLQSEDFQVRAIRVLEAAIERVLGEEATLGRVAVRFWPPGVDADGFHVFDAQTGDTILSAERIRVPLVLNRGGVGIGQLQLQAPNVHLHLEADGKLREFRDLRRGNRPLTRLPWNSLRVVDGTLELEWPDGQVVLDGLELQPDRGPVTDVRGDLRVRFRGLEDRFPIAWDGVVIGPDVIELPGLKLEGRTLQIDARGAVPLSGPLDLDLVAHVELEELNPLMKPPRAVHGVLDADIRIEGPAADPTLAITAAGARLGVDVPGLLTPLLTYELGEIDASALIRKDGVRVEQVVLSWAGGRIVGWGFVTPDKRLVDGHVTGERLQLARLLQAFDAAPNPWVDFDGDAEISVGGTLQPLDLEGTFDLSVAALRVGDRPIQRPDVVDLLRIPHAHARGSLRLEKGHIAVDAPTVQGPRSRGSLTLDVGFGPRGPLDLRIDLSEGDLEDFAPLGEVGLKGRGRVTGRIAGPFNQLSFVGDGDLAGFEVLGIRYADRLTAQVYSPRLKSLELHDAVAVLGSSRYGGDYAIDFRSPMSMSTAIEIDGGRVEDLVHMFVDLDGIRGELLGGSTLTLDGPLMDMSGEAHLKFADVDLYGEHFPEGEGHGYMDRGLFTLDDLRVRRDDGRAGLTLRGSVERDWKLDMELLADGLALEKLDRLKDRDLPLSGRVSVAARIGNTLKDPSPDGRIWVTDVRYAGSPAEDSVIDVDTTDGVAHYRGRVLGDAARIEGTLGLWGEQPYALHARLDDLPAHLFYPEAVDGTPITAVVSGDVDLSGHFGPQWSPVTLSATLPQAEIRYADHVLRNQSPWVFEQDGKRWRVSGFGLAGGRTDVQLSASGGEALLLAGEGRIDLDLLRAVVPGLEKANGTANVVLYAVGARPNVEAVVDVEIDAQLLRHQSAPLSFEDTTARLQLREDRIDLLDVRGGVGGGVFTGSGRLDARDWIPTRWDLQLDVTDAQVQWVESLPPAIGRGRFRFDGPSGALLLSGDIDVTDMTFADRIDWEDWIVEYRDEMLVDPTAAEDVDPMFSLNVHILADQTIWLRNNVAESNASADLRVIGDTVRPGLVGSVTVNGGLAFLQDREFRIDRGALAFNDPWTWDPQLDFSLLTDIDSRDQRYRIDYQVMGPFSNWRTVSRSDPPLPQADVNALLWFGMTTDDLEAMGELPSAVVQGVADLLVTDFLISGQAGEITQDLPVLFDRIDIATGVNARGEYSSEPRLVVEKRLDEIGGIDLKWEFNLVRPDDNYVTASRRIGGIWSLSGWYATLQRDRVLPIGGAYGVDVTARWEVE